MITASIVIAALPVYINLVRLHFKLKREKPFQSFDDIVTARWKEICDE